MSYIEIERKFLVKNSSFLQKVTQVKHISQIYFEKDFSCIIGTDRILSIKNIKGDSVGEITVPNDVFTNMKEIDITFPFKVNDNGWICRLRKEVDEATSKDRVELTIKGPHSGLSKPEYNISISNHNFDMEALMNVDDNKKIEKKRCVIDNKDGTKWEIDTFICPPKVKGLILAEIELPDESFDFKVPEWLGDEVSDDSQYYNKNMLS